MNTKAMIALNVKVEAALLERVDAHAARLALGGLLATLAAIRPAANE